MEHMTRRERERLMHQREIIDAARSIFARKGFRQTTMDDIAEVAEFGKSTIYNHFNSKEDLFRVVLIASFDELVSIVEKILAMEEPFDRKLDLLTQKLLEHALSSPESIYLMARESRLLFSGNPLLDRIPELFRLLGNEIAAEQASGRMVTGFDAGVIAQLLLNMIFGRFTSIIYACFGPGTMEERQEEAGPDPEKVFDAIRQGDLRREIEDAVAIIRQIFLDGVRAKAA